MSIAHNHISGTVPAFLQDNDLTSLDLSYNKLTGEYSHASHAAKVNHTAVAINVHVNRLSGALAHTSYEITRILDGNLFGCDYIPEADEHAESYACGECESCSNGFFLLNDCCLLFSWSAPPTHFCVLMYL